jgi:serine/threonine-protein kinase
MELVEGEDLSERIARGPIPVDEALPIAKQIAEALEAAHEQGIIHRDLKPANIKMRPSGTVKVLDFGLAKLAEPNGSNVPNVPNALSMSPTITSPAMTGVGVVLGTAAYMAPEQAKGKAADKRTDIWAFGCVLYEMLTGNRAFAAEDTAETLAAVIKSEPDWAALPAETPVLVRQTLRLCLEKDLRRRIRHISAAQVLFDEAFEPSRLSEATASVPPSRLRQSRLFAVVASAFIVGGTVGGLIHWFTTTPSWRVEQFVIPRPPDDTQFSFTAATQTLAISRDGGRVVYRVVTASGPALYLRDQGALNFVPLQDTDGARGPFFSPDGQWVGFANRTWSRRKSGTETRVGARRCCANHLPDRRRFSGRHLAR